MGFFDGIDFKTMRDSAVTLLTHAYACTTEEVEARLQEYIKDESAKLLDEARHMQPWPYGSSELPVAPTVEGSVSYPIDDPTRLIENKEDIHAATTTTQTKESPAW